MGKPTWSQKLWLALGSVNHQPTEPCGELPGLVPYLDGLEKSGMQRFEKVLCPAHTQHPQVCTDKNTLLYITTCLFPLFNAPNMSLRSLTKTRVIPAALAPMITKPQETRRHDRISRLGVGSSSFACNKLNQIRYRYAWTACFAIHILPWHSHLPPWNIYKIVTQLLQYPYPYHKLSYWQGIASKIMGQKQ